MLGSSKPRRQQLAIALAGVLHPPVAVVHQAGAGAAARQGAAATPAAPGPLAAEVVGRREADDPPAPQVEHRRQVEPPLARRDVRDVGDPDPVRLAGGEPAIQPLAGTAWPWAESVVRGTNRRGAQPRKPSRRISLATVFSQQATPPASRALWTRGAP